MAWEFASTRYILHPIGRNEAGLRIRVYQSAFCSMYEAGRMVKRKFATLPGFPPSLGPTNQISLKSSEDQRRIF
jgi:hypothetical protein